MTRFSYPIQRALKINSRHQISLVWPKNYRLSPRECEPRYHDVGQFYWFKIANFLKQKKLFCKNSVAVEIAESEVQDIDNFEDWSLAEAKYKLLHKL